MGQVCAQVLYDSVLYARKSTLAYTGAVVSGFEPLNAVDWRDFSIFIAAAGTTYLSVQVGSDTVIDTIVTWRAASGSAIVLTVETSPDMSSWTAATTHSTAADGMSWTSFTPVTVPVGGGVRVRIDGGASSSRWRQISVGARLTFPIGQWVDIAPPRLFHGVVIDTVMSTNGSILGSNLRRMDKRGQIDLTHLDPVWVRASWDKLARHAASKPFWWQWDPTSHPDEVAFASALSIDPPVNMMPPPFMKASMPIRYLTP